MIKPQHSKTNLDDNLFQTQKSRAVQIQKSVGVWSNLENAQYFWFCEVNYRIMTSKRNRKNMRVFDKMAMYILTRNPLQCRTHHQKFNQKQKISPGICSKLLFQLFEVLSAQQRQCLVKPPNLAQQKKDNQQALLKALILKNDVEEKKKILSFYIPSPSPVYYWYFNPFDYPFPLNINYSFE